MDKFEEEKQQGEKLSQFHHAFNFLQDVKHLHTGRRQNHSQDTTMVKMTSRRSVKPRKHKPLKETGDVYKLFYLINYASQKIKIQKGFRFFGQNTKDTNHS